MMKNSKNEKGIIIPFITTLFLIIFFTLVLFFNKINGLSYTALMAISLITGFVIYFKDRIKTIDLREMKIILNETRAVYQSTKNIAENIVEIIGFLSAYGSGSGEQRKKMNNKIRNFLKAIGTNNQKINKIMENPKLMENAMSNKSGLKNYEEKLRKKGLL